MSGLSVKDIGIELKVDDLPEPDQTAFDEEKLIAAQRMAHLKGILQDQDERKNYAKKIYLLIVFWLFGVGLIIVLDATLSPHGYFLMSESVQIALIGGTTANVLGLFIVVVNYLFKR